MVWINWCHKQNDLLTCCIVTSHQESYKVTSQYRENYSKLSFFSKSTGLLQTLYRQPLQNFSDTTSIFRTSWGVTVMANHKKHHYLFWGRVSVAIVMLPRAILCPISLKSSTQDHIYGDKKKLCLKQNISIGSLHASFASFIMFLLYTWNNNES